MIGRSIREVLAEERPLIVPIAHDALSAARLIERAGFKAYSVGGFASPPSAMACRTWAWSASASSLPACAT